MTERELIVDAKAAPGDASDGAGSAMAPVAIPVLLAGALAKFVSPVAGLVGLVAAVVVLLSLRKPNEGRFVLRVVEGGALEVTRERRGDPIAKVPLADILDVTLDRQTRQGGRGGSTERTRLMLERKDAEPIYVPEERITPIEALEWHGKVRVFLRKHEWLPKDERAAPSQ